MSKGGGKAKMQVADYYLSLHYGICYGPIDELKEIVIGEKSVWKGVIKDDVTPDDPLFIDRRNMLGGNKKEGGYQGLVAVLMGKANQVLPSGLAGKLGPVSRVPGFRGLFSLFFSGGSGGFYWGSNTPFIRDLAVKVFRTPKGFYPERAAIPRPGGDPDLDANPAHIIYECATNEVWGAGIAPQMIDLFSLRVAADTLYDEGFGLSLIWTGQQSVNDFINDVLSHINATFEMDPRTGLLSLDLIRDGYETQDLPELTPDNFKLSSFSRRSIDETVNELVVTWRNPETEDDETVTYHDLGNIALQGGRVVSETLDFTGIRSADLAMRVAQREGSLRGASLASVEGQVNRIAWDWLPGQVVLFTWPKFNIERLPVRLNSIDRGAPGSPGINITAAEDVFSLPTNSYGGVSGGTEWVDPSSPPTPFTRYRTIDVPYALMVGTLGPDAASAVEYPDSYVGVFAAPPVPDAYSLDLMVEGIGANGQNVFNNQGLRNLTPYTELIEPLPKEVTSELSGIGAVEGLASFPVGSIFWFGDSEEEHELVKFFGISEEHGNIILTRGVLDTVPRAWPMGTPVWLYNSDLNILDLTLRGEGDKARYRLLTRTSQGLLDLDDAPTISHTVTSRMTRPYRPANVRIKGRLWPKVLTGNLSSLTVSWDNRNRKQEVEEIFSWTAGSISPEVGTSIHIEVLNHNFSVVGNFSTTPSPPVSTSTTISLGSITGPSATVRVSAKRDGIESIQSETHTFEVAGYGMNYGNYYGGIQES